MNLHKNLDLTEMRQEAKVEILGCYKNQKTKLSLKKMKLRSVPPELGQLTHLTDLSLRDNQLTTIPFNLGKLKNLEMLDLSRNQFERVPSGSSDLKNLEALDLSANKLRSIPSSLGDLTNLQMLGLDNNQLRSVPAQLGQLSQLEILYLSDNTITSLPDDLFKLPPTCQIRMFNIVVTGGMDINLLWKELDRIQAIVQASDYIGPRILLSKEDLKKPKSMKELLGGLFKAAKQPVTTFPELTKNEVHKNALTDWLGRLPGTKDWENEESRQRLALSVIEDLKKANDNKAYRKAFFSVLIGATSSCHDSTTLIKIKIELERKRATLNQKDPEEVAGFLLKGVWAVDQLRVIAENKIKTLKDPDQLEVHLAYLVKLREELDLPLDVEGMHFFDDSEVTTEDLAEAKDSVLKKLNDIDACCKFLIDREEWINILTTCNVEAANGYIEVQKLLDAEKWAEAQQKQTATNIAVTKAVLKEVFSSKKG